MAAVLARRARRRRGAAARGRRVAPRLAAAAPAPQRDGRPGRRLRLRRAALFAPWLAPFDPIETSWSAIRKAPSAAHWFGTDEIGRDVFSRVVWGTRASLLAGVVSVSISLALGVPIGLAAGFVGGFVDALISRLTDAFLACPFLILAIALAAFLGPNLTNAMIAIGVSATPIFVRLTRGAGASTSRSRTTSRRRARSATRRSGSPGATCCRTSSRR